MISITPSPPSTPSTVSLSLVYQLFLGTDSISIEHVLSPVINIVASVPTIDV